MAKPKKSRSTRSDSTKFQTEIFTEVIKGQKPPPGFKLTKEEMIYWDAIIAARAEWTKIDLIHAVSLAQTIADRSRHRKLLKKEGDFIKCGKGTDIVNPRTRLIRELTTQSIQLSVKLQIHATATIGDADEQVNKNRAKRLAEQSLNGSLDDDEGLIARPKH